MMRDRYYAWVKLFWTLHLRLYLWSSGRIGNRIRGLPVLVLTTKGRQTGQSRPKALMYLPYGRDFVVIASNLGQDRHPAWWLNLQAEPAARVQVGAEHYAVRAREAEGQEREQFWQALAQKTSDYEQYRSWTARQIPVIVLERQ